jgi:hypothetical protein
MTQHDYVIDNQTAPSFREDLNNALEAIASTNSGPTAPTFEQTFPGMLWYYTGNTDLVVGTQTIPRNSLNIRSEANDLWYPIGRVSTINNQFSLFQGSNVVTNGGATIVGVIDVQDEATWETGTSTTETLISPAKLAAAVGNLQGSKVWRSSDIISWTKGSTYTIPHTLGVTPITVVYQFVCTVAHYGAQVGDVVLLHGGERYANWGIQTTNITSTDITYSFYTAGMIFRDKGSSATVPRSPANWKLRIVATG